MRFQRIIEQTYFRPWLITSGGWQSVHQIVERHVLSQHAERLKEDVFFGEPLPQMTIEGKCATIPIHGTILRKAGAIEQSCGAVGCEDIATDFESAMGNGRVENIILDFDSLGGTAVGIPELARRIADGAKEKNVVAFTGDCMASAAYYLAAGARRVYATPSAKVGSIGVLIPWIDQSAAYEQRGLRVDLITAGKYKGMGYPGTSLTEDQRALLEAGVKATHEKFKAHVRATRTTVDDSSMEGQCFDGETAAQLGLVTNLINSLDELKRMLR